MLRATLAFPLFLLLAIHMSANVQAQASDLAQQPDPMQTKAKGVVLNELSVAINNSLACTSIANDVKRLACFDKAFAQAPAIQPVSTPVESAVAELSAKMAPVLASTSVASPKAPLLKPNESVSQASKQQKMEQEFGAIHLKPTPEDEANSLSQMRASVTKVDKDARRNRIFTLDNGQVWKEAEASRLNVKQGQMVTIQEGALSAFYLSKDNSVRRIRVKRQQ